LTVVGSLLIVSLAAVLGLVCEAFTDLTVRRFLKYAAKKDGLVSFFRQRELLEDHNRWQAMFNQALAKNKEVQRALLGAECGEPRSAGGFFYVTAKDSSIAWLDSHYATYYLASNLAFLAAIFQCYILVAAALQTYSWHAIAVSTAILVAFFYAFCSLGIDRYLYSYMFIFRHSGLTLLIRVEDPKSQGKSEKPHNTGGRADG